MKQIQTTSETTTIWRPLNEKAFFTNVKEVACNSGGVAGAFKPFEIPALPTNYNQTQCGWLPLEVEHQLVNDLAFLAAASEGALSVSALTVSRDPLSLGMVMMVAANSGISKEVLSSLQAICQELQQRARNEVDRQTSVDALFDIIVKLHQNRIHGRIESIYWMPPPHIRNRPDHPFCDIFYASMTNFIATGRKSSKDDFDIVRASKRLHDSMRSVTQAHDTSGLKETVRRAHQLSGTHPSFAARLAAAGHADIAGRKLVRTADKLGRYWKCCERLARMASSKRYKQCFDDIKVVSLNPFEPRIVLRSERHIHAEIQIITYFTLNSTVPKPRVIGISKATCYLCNLFLAHFPEYLVSATHGAIFEHWSIPDLDAYTTADRLKLRTIIAAMNRALIQQARNNHRFEAPAQSGIWHDPCQLSASSCTTVISLASNQTVRDTPASNVADGNGLRNEISSEPLFQPRPTSCTEAAASAMDHKITANPDLTLRTSPASCLKAQNAVGVTEHVSPSEVVDGTSPGTLTPPISKTPDRPRETTALLDRHVTSATPQLQCVLENIKPEQGRVFEADGVRLCFEMENGYNASTIMLEDLSSTAPNVVGRATIQQISNMGSSDGFEIIDLRSMLPGVDVTLQKHDTSEGLGFVLRNGNQGAIQVSCQWSSTK